MTMPRVLRNILIACSFLGRVRIPGHVFAGFDGRMGNLAASMPAAGFLLALPAAALFWLLLVSGAQPLVAALFAMALQTITTGALHEDGLADCADAFGGGKNREHALEIMKDSRIGTFGAVALILSFSLRAALLAALATELAPWAAALLLPASAALARALMVAHWQALPPARETGVAASAGQPQLACAAKSLVAGVLLAGVPTMIILGLPSVFMALFLSGSTAFLMTRLAARKINGHTGDTIGAVEQTGEVVILLAFSLAL